MSIQANITARQTADDLIALSDWQSLEAPHRFWERLRDLAAENLPKPSDDSLPPFCEAVAATWERITRIPYGKHAGELIENVPRDYLVWLAEANDDNFKIDLRRYLKSPQIQRELRKEPADETL